MREEARMLTKEEYLELVRCENRIDKILGYHKRAKIMVQWSIPMDPEIGPLSQWPEHYGIYFVAWTKKPTKEQAKSVKWEKWEEPKVGLACNLAICVTSGDGFEEGKIYPILGDNNGIHIMRERSDTGDPYDFLACSGGTGRGDLNNFDDSGEPSFNVINMNEYKFVRRETDDTASADPAVHR